MSPTSIPSFQVKVQLSDKALAAFNAAAKSGTTWEEKPAAKLGKGVAYLNESDLKPNTSAGRKNIGRFLEAMLADFQTLFFNILKDDKVQVKTAPKSLVPVDWEQLLSRAPGYFMVTYSKPNLTSAQKNVPCGPYVPPCSTILECFYKFLLDFKRFWQNLCCVRLGRLVMKELQSVVPTPGGSPETFLRFLGKIHSLAPCAVKVAA